MRHRKRSSRRKNPHRAKRRRNPPARRRRNPASKSRRRSWASRMTGGKWYKVAGHMRNPRRRRNPFFGRRRKRGGGGGGLSMNSVKALFSKDNVMTAVGAVSAASITTIVFRNFGNKLPGLATSAGTVNPPGLIAYRILIPGLVGILIRKFSRPISDGLIIGGLANGVQTGIQAYLPADTKATLGFSEYLDRGRAVGALGAPISGPGYSGIKAFGGGGGSVLASASPFRSSNW